MRWRNREAKNAIRPHGTYRIVQKFLWWPKSVGLSTRWLCSVWVIQQWLLYEDGVARWTIEAWYEGSLAGIQQAAAKLNEKNAQEPFMKRW